MHDDEQADHDSQQLAKTGGPWEPPSPAALSVSWESCAGQARLLRQRQRLCLCMGMPCPNSCQLRDSSICVGTEAIVKVCAGTGRKIPQSYWVGPPDAAGRKDGQTSQDRSRSSLKTSQLVVTGPEGTTRAPEVIPLLHAVLNQGAAFAEARKIRTRLSSKLT